MTVGAFLKELRQAKGISQKELSGLTGGEVSNAEISRLEAGIRKKPSPAILKILAPHLDVSVGELLTRAGYMDALSVGEGAGGLGEGAVAGESSVDALAYLALQEEVDALRRRCQMLEAENKELEDKCDFLIRSERPSAAGGGASEEEIRTLQEANERLKVENRRIMEETMVFLEEGTALRTEAENYRKKMETAEAAARTARLAQEDLVEENKSLQEANAALESQLRDIGANAEAQSSGDTAAMEQELETVKGRLDETEGARDQLAKENADLRNEVTLLNNLLEEAEGKQEAAGSDVAALEELEAKMEALQASLAEAEQKMASMAEENAQLGKEVLAAKETVKVNTPMLENLSTIQAGDMDLGQIFLSTVKDADMEDLEVLGRLMQAMNKDAIKASDKRMLMDIIKRIVK